MKTLLAFILALFLIAGTAAARDINKQRLTRIEEGQDIYGDLSTEGLFGVAQSGTTWFGWSPSGWGPYSIGSPGCWDFDDRGTVDCPVDDFTESSPVYIKNGAYAQHWRSEDVLGQKGLYWHAEDFTAVPGASPINGAYSGWCGLVTPDPAVCFVDPPGYGPGWSQWLCRKVTLDTIAPSLRFSYRHDSEPAYDYTYVIIDSQFPDSCGWIGADADTLRCYDGTGSGTETIDLSAWDDGGDCDEITFDADYSGDSVKVCFVCVSDAAWDDEDGLYDSVDGMFVVDDIFVNVTPGSGDTVLTAFETGTLEGWEKCGGWSPGDWVAIRDRSDFINNYICGFDNCDMDGCVLSFYNSNIPGQYGNGGHYAGEAHKRAWSPPIDMTSFPTRGYLIKSDIYADLPIPSYVFYRYWVRYWQDPDCPTGAASPPLTDGYVWYSAEPTCEPKTWGFSHLVPADADSVQIGLSAWNACEHWGMPCVAGNESPIFDNVKLGVYDLSVAPQASIAPVHRYTDCWPEWAALTTDATALIDTPWNQSETEEFLRLGDSLVVELNVPDVKVELCFRILPGPGTDLDNPYFTTDYVNPGGWAPCVLSTGDESGGYFCTRMDTAFAAGDGAPGSIYEFQTVFDGYFASMIHEDDPLYTGEGEEIFPDSLFTAGSKIFYAIRSSYLPSFYYSWQPPGADLTNDPEGTAFEISVLPDLCKDSTACLLYVDYHNRGAQAPIENALALLGRTWDRWDRLGIHDGLGNRFLGAGRYRLRGPIGPSVDQLAQYKVILVNTGDLEAGEIFAGPWGPPVAPMDDIRLLDEWLSDSTGTYRGLWLSGDNIATELALATEGPKPGFLAAELAAQLIDSSYFTWSGHDPYDNFRGLLTRTGEMRVVNTYSVVDSLAVFGSGCPNLRDFDVIDENYSSGIEFVSMMYDMSGGYASVDHIFRSAFGIRDTMRTKIDGFSLHHLRNLIPPWGGQKVMVALWMRDVLGGDNVDGYFYDRAGHFQYCPPEGREDPILDVPRRGGRTHANALFQNYPNPFRGGSGTTIYYTAAKAGQATIRIFDAAGRLVAGIADQAEPGGNHVIWNGRDDEGRKMSSGVYFYEVEMGGFSGRKKMLLVN